MFIKPDWLWINEERTGDRCLFVCFRISYRRSSLLSSFWSLSAENCFLRHVYLSVIEKHTSSIAYTSRHSTWLTRRGLNLVRVRFVETRTNTTRVRTKELLYVVSLENKCRTHLHTWLNFPANHWFVWGALNFWEYAFLEDVVRLALVLVSVQWGISVLWVETLRRPSQESESRLLLSCIGRILFFVQVSSEFD